MKTMAGVALAAVAVTVTACAPLSTTTGKGVTGMAPTTRASAPTTDSLGAASIDPYGTDGTWLVPEEIKPGTYRVALTGTRSMGYSKVCADAQCEIGTAGFIDNENYDGPGVLVIPATAVMVMIKGVTLTPMAAR